VSTEINQSFMRVNERMGWKQDRGPGYGSGCRIWIVLQIHVRVRIEVRCGGDGGGEQGEGGDEDGGDGGRDGVGHDITPSQNG
jgi:hypothetical protein